MRYWLISIATLGLVLGFVACGDDDGSGNNESGTGGNEPGDGTGGTGGDNGENGGTGGDDGETGGTGGDDGETGGTGGGGTDDECLSFDSVSDEIFVRYNPAWGSVYEGNISPNILGSKPDSLSLEFTEYDNGTFDLIPTYPDCTHCLFVFADYEGVTSEVTFFQKSGSITIADTSDITEGVISATLNDVVFGEYTEDTQEFIEGGRCLKANGAVTFVVE